MFSQTEPWQNETKINPKYLKRIIIIALLIVQQRHFHKPHLKEWTLLLSNHCPEETKNLELERTVDKDS